MTEESRVVYDGADMPEALQNWLEGWNAARAEGGGDFGAVALGMVRQSRWILDAAPPGQPEPDSPADFAQRLMTLYEIAAAEVRRGNADGAARFAFEAGYLFSQAVVKSQWESHALRGKKNAERLAEGAADENRRRQLAARAEHERWRAMASEIWERRPWLTKSAVGEKIARKLAEETAEETGEKPDDDMIRRMAGTIRKKIKQE